MTSDGYVRSGDGENVFAVGVENALLIHCAIHDVAIIGAASARWGETVKAIVVREPAHAELTESDAIVFAKTVLAGYKCPRSVDFIELPRNPSGKVLKRELRSSLRLADMTAGGAT